MTHRRRGAHALGRWVLFGLGVWGCSAPRRPSAPANDSAGIAIISSAAPQWAAGRGLVLADSPTLVLKGFAGALGAVRLSDRRFVVAATRPPALHFFAADGRPLYVAGGPEDGAGALRSIMRLSVGANDSIIVYDLTRRSLLYFDPNGSPARRVALPAPRGPADGNGYLPKGMTGDGRYLVQRDETPYPFPQPEGVVVADSTRFFWVTGDGVLGDSSPRLYEGEVFGFKAATGDDRGSVLLPLARPLGALLRVAPGPDGVWFGDGRTWEVRHADQRGKVDRIVRLSRPLLSLAPALKDTFVARYRAASAGGDPNGLDRQFAAKIGDAPFPAQLPAFADILVGSDSTVWLQHAGLLEGAAGDGTLDWTVLGADGRWLGDVTMPPHFRPTAIGAGWILGVMRGGGGTGEARLYPLTER